MKLSCLHEGKWTDKGWIESPEEEDEWAEYGQAARKDDPAQTEYYKGYSDVEDIPLDPETEKFRQDLIKHLGLRKETMARMERFSDIDTVNKMIANSHLKDKLLFILPQSAHKREEERSWGRAKVIVIAKCQCGNTREYYADDVAILARRGRGRFNCRTCGKSMADQKIRYDKGGNPI